MDQLVFVMARRQNHFFVELAEALRDELDALGVASSVALDGFPEPRRGLVNVLLPPHEYFALRGAADPPDPNLLRRTAFICAEQPGSRWFDDNAGLAHHAGAVLDINRWAVGEWVRRGVAAEQLQLGWTRRWDRSPFDAERDVDVAFLGAHSDRRAHYLASYAASLWRWRAHLIVSDNGRTNDASGPDFVVGDEKRALLGRSRVLLNVHGADQPYFESLRIIESILCGAVVVSEHSTHTAPFAPGRDFLSGRAENLMLIAQELLEDEPRRRALADEALARLRAEATMRSAAERLVAVAERIDRAAAPLPRVVPVASTEPEPEPDPASGTPDELSPMRRVLKRTKLDLISSRRRLQRLDVALAGGRPDEVAIAGVTPTYGGARPRVSVVVTLYDYERFIEGALTSVAASTLTGFELIVVDDASTDGSLERAVGWVEGHPEMAAIVVSHRCNRGLPHARNAGMDLARGELVFILDADNEVYPHCLARLAEALDANPAAVFAYGMAERFEEGRLGGLLSVGGWDPARLREINYIDAMAMIRLDALRALGGYSDDIRLYGWEDYDLWCKVAERGGHGHAVREILARYRVTSSSMLASVTTLSSEDAFDALADRHPRLMAGATPAGP